MQVGGSQIRGSLNQSSILDFRSEAPIVTGFHLGRETPALHPRKFQPEPQKIGPVRSENSFVLSS